MWGDRRSHPWAHPRSGLRDANERSRSGHRNDGTSAWLLRNLPFQNQDYKVIKWNTRLKWSHDLA